MNSNTVKKFVQDINLKVTGKKRSVLSNFFMGVGIFHSIYTEEDKWQIPLAIFVPSGYIGYHTYKYFDKIKEQLSQK